MVRFAPKHLDGNYGLFELVVAAFQMPFDQEPEESAIRSFRRNPVPARTLSNCWRVPSGSVGGMGTASSIHLVFSEVQMYETHFQRVRTCSFFLPGASWEPDWVAKRDPKWRSHENSK
jgi:hypothetical protein